MKLSHDDKIKLGLSGALAGVLVGSLLWLAGLSPVKAQLTSTNLPVATVTSVSNTSTQIAPANPTRRAFMICNGSTNSIFVAPQPTVPTTTSGLFINTSTCLSPPSNLLASGTAAGGGAGWNGIGTVAGPTSVTFLEW